MVEQRRAQEVAAVGQIADPAERYHAATAALREVESVLRALRAAGSPRPQVASEPAQRVAGVTVRCQPCSRSLGRRAPALVILERAEEPDRWSIHQVATWGRRESYEEGSPRARRRLHSGGPYTPRSLGLELACRRCPHKPRVRVRTLYALADQAVAKGRDYFYR
jgi:hypothetical protein